MERAQTQRFLLKSQRRRWRRDLALFNDALVLYLLGGFELGFAWQETHRSLQAALLPVLGALLAKKKGEATQELLRRLGREYPYSEHRLWFSVLAELHVSGAGLVEATQSFSNSLRQEEARDFDAHCRTLTTKLNLCLLVFFLPPAMLLCLAPFLVEILSAFGS